MASFLHVWACCKRRFLPSTLLPSCPPTDQPSSEMNSLVGSVPRTSCCLHQTMASPTISLFNFLEFSPLSVSRFAIKILAYTVLFSSGDMTFNAFSKRRYAEKGRQMSSCSVYNRRCLLPAAQPRRPLLTQHR